MGMRVATAIGVTGYLLHLPADPVIWTTGFAIIGSIILQVLKMVQDRSRYKQEDKRLELEIRERARRDQELKETFQRVATLTVDSRTVLHSELKKNTELTKEGIVKTQELTAKTEQFAEDANHNKEKFELLAKVSGLMVSDSVVRDTNSTVHRIEDAISSEENDEGAINREN